MSRFIFPVKKLLVELRAVDVIGIPGFLMQATAMSVKYCYSPSLVL